MRPTLAIIETQPIQSVVVEIRSHLYDAKNCEARRDKLRLQAGQKLLGLRKRVEAGEEGDVSWWQWFETADLGNRKYAEQLMRMAGAENPEAALEQENARAKEGMRKARERDGSNVTTTRREPEAEYDPVADVLEIIARMNGEQLAQFTAIFKEDYL